MEQTASSFGAAIRKILKNHPEAPAGVKVKASTTSFAGFGYGSSVTAEVDSHHLLTDSVVEQLLDVRQQFEKQADEGNHFMITLVGNAYPFHHTIRPEKKHD